MQITFSLSTPRALFRPSEGALALFSCHFFTFMNVARVL